MPAINCSLSAAGSTLMPLEASQLIGILALQGSFEAHAKACAAVGARTREVRVPEDLAGIGGLILPGGESTTLTLGIEREGLEEPLRKFGQAKPVMATCAGAILLGNGHLELLDIECRRNAYGRQIRSFEAPLEIGGIDGEAFEGIFIRAPRILSHGDEVRVLARLGRDPVAVAKDKIIVFTFHPELTDDDRLHRLFVELVSGKQQPFSASKQSEEAA